MSEGDSQTVEKVPRVIVADVLVRLKKPKKPKELDFDEEVAILNQLANTKVPMVRSPRNRRQAAEDYVGSIDIVQEDDLVKEREGETNILKFYCSFSHLASGAAGGDT